MLLNCGVFPTQCHLDSEGHTVVLEGFISEG